jgi:aerobic-type carbon monoxide dehydrogenase small subunit (CoxS/CutS family)
MSSTVVDGKTCEISRPEAGLLAWLRSELGLTGVKVGCGEGTCGACTVLVDGQPELACQLRAGEVADRSVTTIEGLADLAGEPLHPVQRALIAERASQCGYCTPGMALRAAALLAVHPDPADGQIAAALDPGLCRCGCYPSIVRAVHRAAALARGEGETGAGSELAATASSDLVSLARPARPWDMTAAEERDWFGVLGAGLVVVWPPAQAEPWLRSGGAWLHVAASGTVTAFTGKVDVGQDNRTAFRLLVAEELAVSRATPTCARTTRGRSAAGRCRTPERRYGARRLAPGKS